MKNTHKKMMLGNDAIALGVHDAGAQVATAYPGTPSTEITEAIAKFDNIYSEWSPNEKVALEVAIGASIAGARAVCSMKHVGLNVAADALFTVAYTGVNGGLVVCVADDPGMHSSQNEQDTRLIARAANVPVLEPCDSQEAYDYVRLAFDLSERYDTPIIVRLKTRLSHSQSVVQTQEPVQPVLKDYVRDIAKYVMMPGMAIKRHVIVEQRMNRMAQDANDMAINRIEKKGEVGVITSGTCYNYVKEALPEASVLKLGLVHPLPKDLISQFAESVKKLYIVEELEPFFEEQIKAMGISVVGKELFGIQGEITANIVKAKIAGAPTDACCASVQLPGRPPVLCAGCPHRAVFYTLNKLKLTVSGDIGCYTLGALPPLNAMDTTICMGASIGMALGMEKARGKEFGKRTVAVIGDSTFIHSGITGLIDVVYNQGNTTTIILDNSITGMTGHQQNPATGKNIKGEPAPQLDLEALCKAIGIQDISIIDPFDMQAFEQGLKAALDYDGASVIIAQRPCALLDKTKSTPYHINEDCRNCKICMRLGCPAILSEEKSVRIDPTQCNGCDLCTKVCPFNAIERAGE
ncbi:MAG: indolepyruvate ferredoxin oxidoreductase subunit alpha [Christensenellales bacterium]|jgi:indolepyruvate ferredoxin oxidoreductase alpha subunit